jgi:hypothetical protein
VGRPGQWEERGERGRRRLGLSEDLAEFHPSPHFCSEVNKSLLTFVTIPDFLLTFTYFIINFLLTFLTTSYRLFVNFCYFIIKTFVNFYLLPYNFFLSLLTDFLLTFVTSLQTFC